MLDTTSIRLPPNWTSNAKASALYDVKWLKFNYYVLNYCFEKDLRSEILLAVNTRRIGDLIHNKSEISVGSWCRFGNWLGVSAFALCKINGV